MPNGIYLYLYHIREAECDINPCVTESPLYRCFRPTRNAPVDDGETAGGVKVVVIHAGKSRSAASRMRPMVKLYETSLQVKKRWSFALHHRCIW
jgi:hypothetical protein